MNLKYNCGPLLFLFIHWKLIRRDENKSEVKKKSMMKIGGHSTLWFYYILLSKKKLVTKSVPILFRALMAVKLIVLRLPSTGHLSNIFWYRAPNTAEPWQCGALGLLSRSNILKVSVFARVGEKPMPPSSPVSLHINHLHSGLIRVVYIMNPCRHHPPSLNLPTSLPLTNRRNTITRASSVPGCVVGTGSQGKLVTPLIQGHQRCASPDIRD